MDFINAKTTDEACLSLIPKIQHEFGFSSVFIKKAEKSYPFLSDVIINSNEKQRSLIYLHFDFWTNTRLFGEALYPLMLEFEEYDLKNNLLIITKEIDRDKKIRIPLDRFRKNFNAILNQIEKYSPGESHTKLWRNYHNELYGQIEKIKGSSHQISKSSGEISNEQEKDVAKLLENEVVCAHHDISHEQVVIKIILNRFINNIKLYWNTYIEDILNKYNRWTNAYISLQPDCSLKNKQIQVREEWFINYTPPAQQDNKYDYGLLGKRVLKTYISAVDYFFVEFLKKDGNASLFHLCEKCGKYFVAKKVDKRIKYCPLCSPKSKMGKEERKEYQKKYRGKKRKEKIAHERGAKINNYMEKLGCTREEAEEIIEADSNL